MKEGNIACHSCGKAMVANVGQLPCEELAGWFTVSQWKGKESVEHYVLCSANCLLRWAEALFPQIPEIFLNSFGEGENNKTQES